MTHTQKTYMPFLYHPFSKSKGLYTVQFIPFVILPFFTSSLEYGYYADGKQQSQIKKTLSHTFPSNK
jgi:hypothetical protein